MCSFMWMQVFRRLIYHCVLGDLRCFFHWMVKNACSEFSIMWSMQIKFDFKCWYYWNVFATITGEPVSASNSNPEGCELRRCNSTAELYVSGRSIHYTGQTCIIPAHCRVIASSLADWCIKSIQRISEFFLIHALFIIFGWCCEFCLSSLMN